MIKVRATQDGHYGGYYRLGPIESDQGYQPGEVFEVDEVPRDVMDEHGRPVLLLDESGKPIPVVIDGKPKKDANGKTVFKIKSKSAFSPSWMERVSDDAEVTNDYPPFQIPSVYRPKKVRKGVQAPVVALPTVPQVPQESPI